MRPERRVRFGAAAMFEKNVADFIAAVENESDKPRCSGHSPDQLTRRTSSRSEKKIISWPIITPQSRMGILHFFAIS